MLCVGKLKKLGYEILDQRIEVLGEESVMTDIITRIAEGDNPISIAKSFGIPYVCLKQWLEEHGSDMVALAKRAHSDVLVATALEEVGAADPETASVAKLRADTYLKIAGKQDKAAWGEGNAIGGSGMGNITIVIGDVIKDEPKVIESDE